jgi:hypothetical protein
MRHDPDFTRAHVCKPLADYPPPFRRVLHFWGFVLPKGLTNRRGTNHAAHRVSLPNFLLIRRALQGCAQLTGRQWGMENRGCNRCSTARR